MKVNNKQMKVHTNESTDKQMKVHNALTRGPTNRMSTNNAYTIEST